MQQVTKPPVTVEGSHAETLTRIFQDEVNLAVWRRPENPHWRPFTQALIEQAGHFERFASVVPGEAVDGLLPDWARELAGADLWLDDVNQLVEMFCCLFEPQAVGVRLHVVDRPLCPRFHTDRVPVRLLCTYSGPGTEWLPEHRVRRSGSGGPLPEQVVDASDIQHIPAGAVALLKGEAWIGNEGRGIVHRSPCLNPEPRLMVGLDWLSD
ncbi:hypothetical protein BTO32_07370 [Marinobacter lutaoensis]|uniref:DUF1826 domain-containing protein n=1 Tax=Marinobacter lutaoensis TaxID=135739 RepID=A0A1V2DUC7_9GAMM|nr:DUF1826 domain-containing protein [Marinobacter lutaoensis]ONF44099.1 hypothetical protein BTO32_07370 [Marinobacter lutaoensis]